MVDVAILALDHDRHGQRVSEISVIKINLYKRIVFRQQIVEHGADIDVRESGHKAESDQKKYDTHPCAVSHDETSYSKTHACGSLVSALSNPPDIA